jgi:DNA-binding CsgD family transcriptional regulator
MDKLMTNNCEKQKLKKVKKDNKLIQNKLNISKTKDNNDMKNINNKINFCL